MLSCPPRHHHHCSLLHHNGHRKPNCTTTTLHLPPSTTTTSSLHHHHHHHNQTPQKPLNTTTSTTTTTTAANNNNDIVLRTHNSKSTSLLLQTTNLPQQQLTQQLQKQQNAILTNHIIQTSSKLTKKRAPRFPGSVSVTEECEGEGGEVSEESVVRALEVRRRVTAEVFKEVMLEKGKFGITYSSNFVGELGWFIDYVMIEAVAMKSLPEFEGSSFNVRAKTVIEDLQVVPLVR